MRYSRLVPLAGFVIVLGSAIWLFALDMRTSLLGIVACWTGVMVASMVHGIRQRRITVGFGLALVGAAGWLIAGLLQDNSIVVGTHIRRSESGQIIAALNYTIGDIARRDLTIMPFLVFGTGLLLMARAPGYGRAVSVMFRLLGLLSLCLFGWLAWDQYLDGMTPPFIDITLKLLFGLGWAALGYLLMAHGSRSLTTLYRHRITRS